MAITIGLCACARSVIDECFREQVIHMEEEALDALASRRAPPELRTARCVVVGHQSGAVARLFLPPSTRVIELAQISCVCNEPESSFEKYTFTETLARCVAQTADT
jgi:hypothetical protein